MRPTANRYTDKLGTKIKGMDAHPLNPQLNERNLNHAIDYCNCLGALGLRLTGVRPSDVDAPNAPNASNAPNARNACATVFE